MSTYRTFLVPYDFSDHARAALDVACDLSRSLEPDLQLLHVVHTPSYAYVHSGGAALPYLDMTQVKESAAKALVEVAGEIDVSGKVEARVVEGAGIAATICEVADETNADLIVMGTHGRTGLAHAFLGSTAERTLRKSPCPVLTVRAPEEDE